MSDQFSSGSSDTSYLARTFESLRKGVGLKTSKVTDDLLRLPVIQRQLALNGDGDRAAAAVQVVRETVRKLAEVTDRIIADAVLGLEIYVEDYRQQGILDRDIRILQVGALGKRRNVLRSRWSDLHEALAVSAPDLPSDRNLRGPIEERVFKELASLLVDNPAPGNPGTTHPTVTSRLAPGDAPPPTPAGKVIVVGGAAIDHIWRVEQIPKVETSTIADNYVRTPGGKGLNQAVAAARLGLDVSLIAAVTDDREGLEIIDYLTAERVDTSLLRHMPKMRTPQTGVNEQPRGDSNAVVWRSTVQLNVEHMEKHSDAISNCDVLMVTFEVPKTVLNHALNLATESNGNPPVVIVTSGQPYHPNNYLPNELLRQIDYLVAHMWELEDSAPSPDAKYDPDLISQDLLSRGLKSVCILENRRGAIYSRTSARPISAPSMMSLKESSITRDVFCAALARHLVGSHSLSEDAIEFADAAMATFAQNYRLTSTPAPPRLAQIEGKMSRSIH